MTDFATLGIVIDSTSAKSAAGDLDRLASSGGRAEGSVRGLGTAASGAGAQIKGASAAAAQYAANAQAAARAATGWGRGASVVGSTSRLAAYQAQNLAFQINDVATGLASGQAPFRVFAQQGGQFFQIMQQSGLGARAFAVELLRMTGILKVTRDAELAEEAANAAAAATAVKGAAQRAAANIVTADTEVALAAAAVRTATTSEALTAAQARLATAHEAVVVAAAEATIAENALTVAMEREAVAATAAAVATTVALGPMAGILIGVGIAATGAVLSFQALKKNVADKGILEDYARSLHLSAEQFDELKKKTDDFGLTFGDVWNGIKKTISDSLDASPAWQRFKDGNESAFKAALDKAVSASALIGGFFIGAYRTIVQTFSNLPNALGSAFVSAVNAAISEINKLMKASIDSINGLIDQANKLPLVNLGHLGTPQISAIKDNYAKAGREAWKSFAQNVAEATNEIRDSAQKGLSILWSNIIGAAEERIKDAAGKPPKGKKPNDHGLADALAELDAQIRGQLRLAEAYQISDAAAIKAEALQKAEEQAIRHKGEVGLFYEKELALAVATRAADGAKVINQLSGETAARRAVNDAVKAGTINAAQASNALRDEAQLRPLIAAQAVAEGKAKDDLTRIIARLRAEQAASNAEANRAQVIEATASIDEQIDRLELETRLIGENSAARAVAIARLEAEQYLRAHPVASAEEAQTYIDSQTVLADATERLRIQQDNYNASLSYTHDLLAAISDQAGTLGEILSSAFGGFGDSIGTALNAFTQMQAQQQAIADWRRDEIKKAGGDANRLAQIEVLANKASTTAQMKGYAGVITGIKSLFKEHSTAYKVMSAVEKAYALFQAAETIASIVRDTTKTASAVANSAVRTTANTAEGGSKIFAELGPWAFPVVAAMVAVLAALGAKGGGGGSRGPSIPSADDVQAAQGAGSILGAATEKSNSIANSLEIVAANTNKDLEYSNAMLMALRNIDLSIAKMAGTVAKQIQVSGSLFDTSKLKLGTSGSKGFLGLIGGSTTERNLYDLGINLAASTVGNIIANGISGNSYQIVQKIKTSSGFLGIGGGTKTSYTTTNGQIDPEITAAIQGVILSLRDGLIEASKVFGINGAQAILDAFQVSIGKISFKDMTGQEIEDALNAIFSKVGDQMAGALLPSLSELQKVGEGLFETFIRVAREYQVVDVELQSIGKTFGAVGVASIAARDNLVQLFGGMDEFVDATDKFRDAFLSEAEQIAPVQQAVVAEMQRLGLAGVVTRDQFKAAVLGLDLTTQAGRDMYAALLQVAPAFDKVLDYFDKANKAQIDALQSTADKFNGFATSLRKYRDTLFATDAANTAAYSTLRAKFVAAATLAATGDATALGGLESAGKDFLTAAKNNASSLLQYQRDVALVARGVDKGIFAAESTADYAQLQLDALKNATTILGTIALNTQATAAALNPAVPSPATVPAPAAGSPASPGSPAPVVLDANAQAELAAIRTHMFELKQLLKRWDDGDAMKVTAPEAIDVNLESWG